MATHSNILAWEIPWAEAPGGLQPMGVTKVRHDLVSKPPLTGDKHGEVKNLPAMWETWVRSLAWEDPLEKGKATHSSLLAWRIPWTVQSMGLQKVGHD